MNKKFKRILIVQPFGIGDVLFITPLIRALSKAGAERIDLLLGSRTREVFEHNPFIFKIYERDKTEVRGFKARFKRWVQRRRLYFVLNRNRYDVFIDLSFSRGYGWLGKFVFWIPVRIGFDFKNRGNFLTHKIQLPAGLKDKPVSDYYLDLLSFIGIQPEQPASLDLFLSLEDERYAEAILSRLNAPNFFITVALGGGESWGKDARLKHWPVKHFAELIRKILERTQNSRPSMLIVGTSSDQPKGEFLKDCLKACSIHNLCGQTSIRVAAAIMKRAGLFIGNDGGLLHVASAVGTPLIGLFGPVDPLVYGPYPKRNLSLAVTHTGPECRPCYQSFKYQNDCVHVACLNSLDPGQVFEKMCESGFFEMLKSNVATHS